MSMPKRVAVGIAFFLFTFTPAFAKDAPQPKLRTEPLTITGADNISHLFEVEIAVSEHEREMGLMFRDAPKAGEGMLFLMADEQTRAVSMWMKNTPAALDMIFIENDGRIASLKGNAEPFSQDVISSGVPVSAVLELASGAIGRFHIKIGDHVRNKHFCGETGCPASH